MTYTYKPYTRECYEPGCSGTMQELPESSGLQCPECEALLPVGMLRLSTEEIRAVFSGVPQVSSPEEIAAANERMAQAKARLREESARRYADKG